ncbi:hypothetical protein CRG98_013197 [Punica granatum]|nr:hypothetical protein CRG98_013197 [Punica granatum]
MGFVGTNSTHFVEAEGQLQSTLYVNGWNSYWLMEESVWGNSRRRVSKMLRKGAEMGMTVCRTWAFSDGGDGAAALQTSPGVFNERVFKGLDYVIVEARRNRVRLILSLVNNLDAYGGKAQYVRWAREAGLNVSSTDSFFAHPTIKDYYKAYIKAIVTRKNSLSGVRYFAEPAIFAWELMNEPRCSSSSSSPILQAWITEMAAFIKSLDPKHLVTVGTEGFYGSATATGGKLGVNPGEWAASLGTDFLQNSAIKDIDFASVHAYPDSWIPKADLEAKVKYLSQWVDSHIKDGDNTLKKPVLFTEVGSSLHDTKGVYEREVFLKTIYDKVYDSAKKRQAGAGALIWQLLVEDIGRYGDRFSLVAWHHPSTYNLIQKQSCKLRSLFATKSDRSKKLRKSDPCFDHGS